ncbi:hypothetical protein A2Z23_01835 [Candidatus Curtissbacteria bacterium RBG_16_39_7]|uniref:Methyltransferase type 11 domain-containing protein n=1 Tax=Candidatus Curtissbacteria bacterium RBG_16_39_7 TaxID=1797707 RepID=A0A1F5G249_9BACT|nr:MAG: hypothetical protein A2Z23_01835 [Candidatus Curtissbacteria bacterium RBG_16_39_7]
MGKFLGKSLGCKVTGVEIDKKFAQVANGRITKVIVGDLENDKIQTKILQESKFDVIFASAILEHLKRPEQVLKNLIKSLKKGKIIIITLPNVACWRTRLELLMGRFNYTESGILDKGHLRFFTVKSAIQFIEGNCKLKIDAIDFEFPLFPIIHRIFKLIPLVGTRLQFKFYRRFPNFFAYQIVFKTRPK